MQNREQNLNLSEGQCLQAAVKLSGIGVLNASQGRAANCWNYFVLYDRTL